MRNHTVILESFMLYHDASFSNREIVDYSHIFLNAKFSFQTFFDNPRGLEQTCLRAHIHILVMKCKYVKLL